MIICVSANPVIDPIAIGTVAGLIRYFGNTIARR